MKYLIGLLLPIERKNVENIAEEASIVNSFGT
jgi:hypothetical protein